VATTITVYDGANCIGGNKVHLESDGMGVLFDFGMNYGVMGRYYEDFLSPRSSRGLYDYIQMGILPKIDAYRSSLIPNDLDMSGAKRTQVDALLISHAHLDHIGLAGFLDIGIPFVCTPMTAALIKAMSEVSGNVSDCVACPEKDWDDDGRALLRSSAKTIHQRRQYMLTDKWKDELNELWLGTTRKLKKNVSGPELAGLGGSELEIMSFPVDHSIFGATAYAVNTTDGWVVYTGDIRLHGRLKDSSMEFLEKARGLNPKVLIIEGTRAFRPNDLDVTEEMVRDNCLNASEDVKGLVVADFGPRNFERLDTFIEIARKVGRHLVVTMRDAYMLDAVRCVDGVERMKDVLIFGRLRSEGSGLDSRVMERYADRIIDPLDIRNAPDDHILCFSYTDMNDLLDVSPHGGRYIYSSSEAFSEESVFSFQRLANWLDYFKLVPKGFKMNGAVPDFDAGFHASGHVGLDDLRNAVERIDAELVIPVHTTHAEQFNSWADRVIVPEAGKTINVGRH
jgi:ribonuclease J